MVGAVRRLALGAAVEVAHTEYTGDNCGVEGRGFNGKATGGPTGDFEASIELLSVGHGEDNHARDTDA